MKHYESYVAEARARYRRRFALGIAGVVVLVALGASALLVMSPESHEPSAACASGVRTPDHACADADSRPAG
jgi:hypothetical protein